MPKTSNKVPAWCRLSGGRAEIEPGKAYASVLNALGVERGEVSQYWLEVCRRCCTQRLREILGVPLRVRILPGPAWTKLRSYPPVSLRGDAAAGASGFLVHYASLRDTQF